MSIPSSCLPFWQRYVAATGRADEARFLEAFAFGDSPEMADELVALVLAGTKRATAGAYWAFEAGGQRLPQPGDLSIVLDSGGRPCAVIETRAVCVRPFREVDASFAATEGEGDGSLAFWQAAHRAYFTRSCARAGRKFSEDMLVVCEEFACVFPPVPDKAESRGQPA